MHIKMFLVLFFLFFSTFAFALPEGYVEAETDVFFDLKKEIQIEKIILKKNTNLIRTKDALCIKTSCIYLINKKQKPKVVAALALNENNNKNNIYFIIYSTKREKLEKVLKDFGLTKVSIGDTLVVVDPEIQGEISVEEILDIEQTKNTKELQETQEDSSNLQLI